MAHSPLRWIGTSVAACALTAGATTLVGCDAVAKLAGIQAPEASLLGVDLVKNPNLNRITRWGCYELFGSVCDAQYNGKPDRDQMIFSFDLGFDLENPNADIAIPLVEILMGLLVYDDNDLGAVCISFCDPDAEDCQPSRNAEGACSVDDAKQVDSASDLIPTADQALEIASDVASGSAAGSSEENGSWKVVPPKDAVEGHVQFDIDPKTIMDIVVDVAARAIENGNLNNLDVPYETEGNLFFNVPRMGRYAFGYGPWADQWDVN